MLLLGKKPAADDGLDAEQGEQVRRHAFGVQFFRLEPPARPGGEVELRIFERGDGLEHGVARLPFHEVGGRDVAALQPVLAVLLPDGDDARGIAEREVAQEHGVDHAEDGGIGADAEGQRQDRDGGEAGRLAEQAEPVAEVLRPGRHF